MLPHTIDEVLARLDEIIVAAISDEQPNGYFAALYRQVTQRVKERIADGDYFDDNARMERLDVVFANRYLAAFDGYAQSKKVSRSWQVAFEASLDGRPIVLQHLLLGMNAHIGLDLGIAAAMISPGKQIDALAGDFAKINDLLAAEIDGVQGAIARFTPLLKVVDAIGGRMDEAVAKFSMDIARNRSWRVATELAAIGDPHLRAAYIEERDLLVANFSERLYQPRPIVRWLMRVLRLLEKGSVGKRISTFHTG